MRDPRDLTRRVCDTSWLDRPSWDRHNIRALQLPIGVELLTQSNSEPVTPLGSVDNPSALAHNLCGAPVRGVDP